MIDVDWLETQLERAVTEGHHSPAPAPAPAPAAGPEPLRRPVSTAAELVPPRQTQPLKVRNDRARAARQSGGPRARAARQSGGPRARAARQSGGHRSRKASAPIVVSPPTDVGRDWDEERFRTALDSHDDDERYRLLDHCRQRAYADDDLMWRSALTLVLARMGRHDEARREMDATSSRCRASALDSATASAIEAKLAEAGSVLDGRLISATRST